MSRVSSKRSKLQMTQIEFDTIRPFLKMTDNRKEAARLAMVDGQTWKSVAALYGCTPQSVGDAVKLVWRTLERYHKAQQVQANAAASLPPGWERVTLTVPQHLIPKFQAEIAQAHTDEQDIKKPATKRRVQKKKA